MHRSLELLFALGALDAQGILTDHFGRNMARLPVDPMYARVLLASGTMGCTVEAMQARRDVDRMGGLFRVESREGWLRQNISVM